MWLNGLLRRNNPRDRMSVLGQKRTSEHDWIMSALSPIADIANAMKNVRFVPKADIHKLFDRTNRVPRDSCSVTILQSSRVERSAVTSSHEVSRWASYR